MSIPMDVVYVPDEYGNLIQTRVPTAIGFPTWFAGPEIPEGYLYCDGSEVNRNVYKELFAAIGTTWGAGDGADTFNIPDLRGIFVRGDGGENNADLGVRQGDAIRNIKGRLFDYLWQDVNGGDVPILSASNNGCFGNNTTDTNEARSVANPNTIKLTGYDGILFDASRVVPTAAENRPVNVALRPCIRYV
ncbi:phage tail protein [Cloacibacillus sp. An23]|uniref:phage tail protein n=1 Tax=Cloacibacillus sp. An23 TaxID=1965591 RepID=UPI000B39B9EA|nr:phage tail protein [Cloacibacillus sp. An23]OUO94816.1 hypothetical protein B5F39_02810 [Cloacibacillus sp. An23]